MNIPEFNEIIEPNDQTEARREHLDKWRELVGNVYPNKFDRSQITGAEDTISNVLTFEPLEKIVGEIKAHISTLGEKERPAPELKEKLNARLKEFGTVRIAGRLTTPLRGNFVHLTDGKAKFQIYCKQKSFSLVRNDAENSLDEENAWAAYKMLDQGDFVGVEGYLFLTNTGELSVHVETLQFLSKAMLPMPDKIHGISDPELQRRYRYADLIASSLQIEHEGLTTREVFERRAKLVSGMRRYLDDAGYIEVETPMLTPKATGAAATPFVTHHNALDITLYARIAPELYLKRLTVGGFEKVYELNRNFRNEGLSQKHNPEFTMLEFYCAYMDVGGMMDFAEEMIKESVQKATGGSLQVKYGENEIDFSKFERLSMQQAITNYLREEWTLLADKQIEESWLNNLKTLRRLYILPYVRDARSKHTPHYSFVNPKEAYRNIAEQNWQLTELFSVSTIDKSDFNELRPIPAKEIDELNKLVDITGTEDRQKAVLIERMFEDFVESELINPTFIVDYPKSISPLSKASPANPNIAERFELFINGMEVANGFSELNDPQEQYDRFVEQMKERAGGDEEAMILDEDYIRALSYGMPPAAGIGIGIDRLTMLLTNKHSIRDVILFPHMRPERRDEEAKSEGEAEMET